jgi:hypothetical protein
MKTRSEIRKMLVDTLEECLRFAYGWLSDNDESLSKITFVLHIFLLLLIFLLILVSHIIYPVLWFQCLVFFVTFVVWIQHIVLHMCVCTSLEIKLGGIDSPIAVDPLLSLFSIPISRESRIGVTILMTSMMTLFLGLGLTSRGVCYIRKYYGFSNLA